MIGKTRQTSSVEIEEIFDPQVGKARGILRPSPPAGKFKHMRRAPASDLAHCIAHYWMVSWDLRDCEPYPQETLPHPNIHLIFEKDTSRVCGVHTGKFSRVLEGQSRVFGIKFTPGGFRPFLNSPASSLVNRVVPANRIFGNQIDPFETAILSTCDKDMMIEAANTFFRIHAPKPDPTIELVGRLVASILQEPEIKTVDHLVVRADIGKRSLQRLFTEYVGVSPKWVIRRYRLHELIEKFNSGSQPDWAQLALELGYFDQAHLINDFKSFIGYSPTQYLKLVANNSF